MRVRIALGMSATAVVMSLGAIGYSAINNGHRVDDVAHLSAANQQLLAQIQGQRVANIRANCETQNASNTRVNQQLLKLTSDSAKKQGRTVTEMQKQTIQQLANAISERRDCNAVVRKQTGSTR